MQEGLKEIKDIVVGDKIIGADGSPTEVTDVYELHYPEKMYKLTLDNGEVVKCSGNHLWYCETDEDKKEKRKYLRLAKQYFKNEQIPNYVDGDDPAYPYELIANFFTEDEKLKPFIQRVSLSMGPTYATPHITYDNYMEKVDEEMIWSYSINNLIDFLSEMKKSVMDKNGYFYFGKVRETDEIFLTAGEVNIPTVDEIKTHKK